MREKMKQGSFAVEASFVLPFLVLIVFVCICLALYLHDRSVLASCAAETAGKGAARKYRSEKELEAELSEEALALAFDRLMVCRELEVSVKVTAKSVTVSYTGGNAPSVGALFPGGRDGQTAESGPVYADMPEMERILEEVGDIRNEGVVSERAGSQFSGDPAGGVRGSVSGGNDSKE